MTFCASFSSVLSGERVACRKRPVNTLSGRTRVQRRAARRLAAPRQMVYRLMSQPAALRGSPHALKASNQLVSAAASAGCVPQRSGKSQLPSQIVTPLRPAIISSARTLDGSDASQRMLADLSAAELALMARADLIRKNPYLKVQFSRTPNGFYDTARALATIRTLRTLMEAG